MSGPAPDTVSGADTLREGLAERSQTIGGIANRLDAWAVEVGDWRVSAFDVLFTVAAIVLVLAIAMIATRLTRSALRRATRLDGTQRVLAEKLATIVIWVVTFLVGIDLIGIEITAITVFGQA